MAGALAAPAIALAGAVAVALIFASFWGTIRQQAVVFGAQFARELDISDIKVRPEDVGYTVVGVSAAVWFAAIVLLRPSPVVGGLYLTAILGFSAYATKVLVQMQGQRRIKAFLDQFEGVLRSLAGGVRAGLGLRQGLMPVSEHTKDPIRKELERIAGASNLGVSVLDAFDELARRFPTGETEMLSRVVRVNAETGGDLSLVLENLADTIRDRRKLDRRVKVMTAQARISAWVIGLLPLFVGAAVLLTQPRLREAVLSTNFGHIVLLLGLGLDAAAFIVLTRMARFTA
jgi:tight adherence protein B